MWRNHLRFDGALVAMGRRSVHFFVIIVITAVEVGRSFVLIGSTMVCISGDKLSHIS
jgi:hypothetical protein